MKKFLIALVIVLMLSGCVSKSDYDTLKRENDLLNENITALEYENSWLEYNISIMKIKIDTLTESINTLTENNTELMKKIRMYETTFGKAFSDVEPQYWISFERMPNLVNNPESRDLTWEELKTFLKSDKTEEKPYIEDIYQCGSYAEELHNNAESHGIRTAFVAVSFTDSEDNHALNAFKTTDYGLVYIDDTSENGPFENMDKLCFVESEKEYVCLDIDNTTPLCDQWCYNESYQKFEDYNTRVKRYNERMTLYNIDVRKFNNDIRDRTFTVGTTEWTEIKLRESELISRGNELDIVSDELDEIWKTIVPVYGSLGIVDAIEIYW